MKYAVAIAVSTFIVLSAAVRPHHKNVCSMWSQNDLSFSRGCEPQDVIVTLGSKYSPNFVKVKRCVGGCPGMTCVPLQQKELMCELRLNNDDFPKLVPLVEHEVCGCACPEIFDCDDEGHGFSQDVCRCICINQDDRRNCTDMEWDEKECRCTNSNIVNSIQG